MKDEDMKLSAVIFDVDGTLVDSNDLHARAWQEAFRKFGKEIPFSAIRGQIGKGGDQLMPEFLSQDELERLGEDLEEYRSELFKEKYLDQVQPFPRVRDLFEHLKSNGLLIALASSAKEEEVQRHQETLGITGIVDHATSADDASASKPEPHIFNAAAAGLGISASEAVVVGDTPWDVIAARKAKMEIICLLSGGFDEQQLRSAGAAEIYQDVTDLLEKIENSILTTRRTAAASA
jgi:HAD superfamily hydrolase (TIGR01549 family)